MTAAPDGAPAPARRASRLRWRPLLLGLLLLWLGTTIWHQYKPLLPGLHVDGAMVATSAQSLHFLADLTTTLPSGELRHDRQIHAATLELVRDARDFLVLDYFLFNDQGGPRGPLRYERGLEPVSAQLIAAVRELKQVQPALPVLVLVDPINGYYTGEATPALAALRDAGVDVVVTRLDGLRDSNPAWSTAWRMLFAWWQTPAAGGRWNNLLDGAGPPLNFGALARIPNFKANHRKLALTGDGNGSLRGILTSANPHDASSAHSNVGLRLAGESLRPLLASELAVATFSGWQGGSLSAFTGAATGATTEAAAPAGDTRTAVITEAAIRTQVLARLAATQAGDAVDIAQFYLSERQVIEALLAAAQRGVTLRVLLDPNRDAFGFEKSGIPNRQVAAELLAGGRGNLQLRWYRTQGEQFHAKLTAVRSAGRLWFTLGSANFTRRNLDDYNLEANAVVDTPADSAVALQVSAWFEKIWSNPPGTRYSADAAEYAEDSRSRYWLYRLMEGAGTSTF